MYHTNYFYLLTQKADIIDYKYSTVMGHTKLAYWLIAHDPSDSMIVSQDIMGHTPAHDAAEQG